MRKINKIVVFDTETSGLYPNFHAILSLSWQVLDKDLKTVAKETRYFDWPSDRRRVNNKAILVNGLTRETLKKLGTCSKREALIEFSQVIADADLLVAHNGGFDRSFVKQEATREGVEINLNIHLYDTMHNMTEFCAIPGYYDGYKWPTLLELSKCLSVETKDIDWHTSEADVEVTARCFRKIVNEQLTII